jgi:hypothetical protein
MARANENSNDKHKTLKTSAFWSGVMAVKHQHTVATGIHHSPSHSQFSTVGVIAVYV